MDYFADYDTGYYDTDTAFYAHDREMELKAEAQEARYEYEAEHAHDNLWSPIDENTAGPIVELCDAVQLTFGMSAREILATMRKPVRRTKRVHAREVA